MKISIIVAKSRNNVIGKDNKLLWKLPDDMKFFKEKTEGKAVVMGRKTYMSIPKKFRALPGRTSIILSRKWPEGEDQPAILAPSLEAAITFAKELGETELMIIGGAEIYKQALPLVDKIYLTDIKEDFEGDVLFPELFPEDWTIESTLQHEIDEKHKHAFSFIEMEKKSVYYYAYGSNMNMEHFSKFSKILEGPIRGTLHHFDLEFNKISSKDPSVGFANVIPKWDSTVEGAVYRIYRADLMELDRKEGYPNHYQRTMLSIDCGDKSLNCVVYMANYWKQNENLKVSDTYKETISNGMAILSDNYKQQLLEKMNKPAVSNEHS